MGKFHVYKDQAGEFRWRLVAPNGRIIADSGEGYSSKQKCLDGIADVKQYCGTAETVEE
ncbi:YegP family protein [Tautonia rosea]|uniref:YegP family protein n=1 Tax=Tautonia rosea TaxID=2728037 RepID=UPI001474991D|nr:DUF1508 domain-containing protein [Tautonia rosea]